MNKTLMLALIALAMGFPRDAAAISDGAISCGNGYLYANTDTHNSGTAWIVSRRTGSSPDITIPSYFNYETSGRNYGGTTIGIGAGAFNGDRYLASITIQDPCVSWGAGLFESCIMLRSVVFPLSFENLPSRTFIYCTAITEMELPITLRTIGEGAFIGCSSLTNVIIHGNVTSVGSGAFLNCSKLEVVEFRGDAPSVSVDNIFQGTPQRMIVKVPRGSLGWNGAVSSDLPKLFCGRTIIYSDQPIEMAIPGIKIPPVVTNYVHLTVTNEVFHHETVTNIVVHEHATTVTNVVEHHHYTTVTNVVRYVPEPGTSPAPAYRIDAGASAGLQIAGAAGWDAYGVPDGITWDQTTGVLSGAANKSGVYDLLLVSGSGAETKIMRTTLEVKGYATIVGHVGVAFSKSGAPVNCLKSYKTLPAGLKWDAKTKILSGIPTKAQTLSYETVYGDPVTVEIKPAETTMAGTYNGMIGYRVEEGEGDPWHAIGNLTVTAAATGKLSAKVVAPQGTYSFSASAWDSVSDGIYRVDMSTKAGDTLCIVLDTTKDWKEDRLIAPSSFKIAKDANTYIVSAWRNEHGKTDAIAKDPVASEFISRIKALKKMYLKATKVDDDHYTLETQTAAKGADVTLTFNANGTVAYSGKVGGTKVSGTSTLAVDGDSYYTIFDLVVPVSKTRAMHFAMGFDKGPSSTPIPDFEVAVSDVLTKDL